MKRIVGMNLGLENMEEIALRLNEFEDLDIDNIKEGVAQCFNAVLQFHTCDFIHFRLKAQADHTYNSFDEPSEMTVFKRLTSVDDPLAYIKLVYEDGTALEVFLPDSMSQSFSVDPYGDLHAIFAQQDDCCAEDDDDCECGCCCGDCEE